VAVIGLGAAVLADRDALGGAASIGGGVAAIGAGVAVLADRDVLLGAAVIGVGVAVIGVGVAVIGPSTMISAVRRVIDSATRVPQTPNDQEPAQQESDP
jgi:hypothetical protein